MLHQDVFNWLRQCWLMTIDLFASSLSHRCSVYFAPVSDPSVRHDQPGLGEGEGLSEPGADAHCSILAPASVVSRAADSAPSSSSISVGSSASATRQKIPPKLVHASSSCVETLRRGGSLQ